MPAFIPLHLRLLATRVVAGLLLAGCNSTYDLTVHSTASAGRGRANLVSYRIVDLSAPHDARPLRLDEVATQIKTALSAQGLYEASDPKTADLCVEVTYGVAAPRRTQTVYQELVHGRPVSPSEHAGPPPEGVARELMGYTALATTTVTHEKHLCIRARENRETPDAAPSADVWRVEVRMATEQEDLRGHLPILAAVAMDRIDRPTDGSQPVRIRADDEALRFIRRGP